MNQVVNEHQVKDEIAFLRRYCIQRNLELLATVDHEYDIYCTSKKLKLLLEWCRSVCRLFGVKVRKNVSFIFSREG